jgi:adenine-specific DNA-methyltransferase
LIIELDGGQHNEPAQAAYDSRRTEWFAQQGFRVIRFWDHEVLKQLDDVKTTIDRALTKS